MKYKNQIIEKIAASNVEAVSVAEITENVRSKVKKKLFVKSLSEGSSVKSKYEDSSEPQISWILI